MIWLPGAFDFEKEIVAVEAVRRCHGILRSDHICESALFACITGRVINMVPVASVAGREDVFVNR